LSVLKVVLGENKTFINTHHEIRFVKIMRRLV